MHWHLDMMTFKSPKNEKQMLRTAPLIKEAKPNRTDTQQLQVVIVKAQLQLCSKTLFAIASRSQDRRGRAKKRRIENEE